MAAAPPGILKTLSPNREPTPWIPLQHPGVNRFWIHPCVKDTCVGKITLQPRTNTHKKCLSVTKNALSVISCNNALSMLGVDNRMLH